MEHNPGLDAGGFEFSADAFGDISVDWGNGMTNEEIAWPHFDAFREGDGNT
jgi:hypothetical protein